MTKSGSSLSFETDCTYRKTAYKNPPLTGRYTLTSSWSLDSLSHKAPYGAGDSDNGGPFFLTKDEYVCSPAVVNEPNNGSRPFYQGSVIPKHILYVTEGAGFAAQPTDASIIADGTTAIARTEPTNPAISLSTAIGELRNDGLPTILGSSYMLDVTKYLRRSKARSVSKNVAKSGGEYLNVEFGWKPLISDVRKLAVAVRDSHEIIEQYRRNSDKKIRRRFEYPSVQSTRLTTSSQGGAGVMYFYPGSGEGVANSATGAGTLYETYLQRRWFSGAFRYHVPVSDDQLGKLAEWKSYSDKLLGQVLTPEVLWNLSPWTWAADWFTNTGDILHNISAMGHDGLVLQYGYSMAETIRTAFYSGAMNGTSGWGGSYPCTKLHTVKSARRIPATPYGFGVDLNSLTAKQTAIVAALGLSRGGRPNG